MSEIPFVNQLGDAIETAVTPAQGPLRPRHRRRRFVIFALGGALVVGGGAAAATGLFGSEQQATADIACYQGEQVQRSFSQEPAAGRDPVAFCREQWGTHRPVPPLVACAGNDMVAVIPGRAAEDCRRVGFKPLAAGFDSYRAKVSELQRGVLALEREVDCLPRKQFAVRLQALLDRLGWDGWRTRLSGQHPGYPCGAVSGRGGAIDRTLAGSLDGRHKLVSIRSDWSYTVDQLLYGRERGVFRSLMLRSGKRCYSTRELAGLVRRAVSGHGLRTNVIVGALPEGSSIGGGPPNPGESLDERGTPYEAGCSIITMLEPAKTSGELILRIARKA